MGMVFCLFLGIIFVYFFDIFLGVGYCYLCYGYFRVFIYLLCLIIVVFFLCLWVLVCDFCRGFGFFYYFSFFQVVLKILLLGLIESEGVLFIIYFSFFLGVERKIFFMDQILYLVNEDSFS